MLDEGSVQGLFPLPFPAFRPLTEAGGRSLHYRSNVGGAAGGGGGGGK